MRAFYNVLFTRIGGVKMGKQLDIYKKCKINNPNKHYLFKGGVFYYFVAEDAEYFSITYGFKLISFGDSVKCGFPTNSLEKYLYLFNKESIEVITEDKSPEKIVIDTIKGLDINDLGGEEAINILINLKETLHESE